VIAASISGLTNSAQNHHRLSSARIPGFYSLSASVSNSSIVHGCPAIFAAIAGKLYHYPIVRYIAF
jgi:hypothetical protein